MTKYKFWFSQLFSFCCLLLSSICIIELISPWLAESFIPWMERHLSLSSKAFKIVFFLILLLSSYPISKIHKFRCIRSRGNESLKYALVFIITASLYRLDIIAHQWVFTSYCNVNLLGWNIAYVDLLALYVVFIALQVAVRWTDSKQGNTQKTLSENKKSIPSLEEPISCSDADIFAFNKDAISLIKNIDQKEIEKQALVIGLRGAWGSGKTSYLNILKQLLDVCENHEEDVQIDNSYRVVEFSPWLSTDIEQMTKDFFDSFHEAIKEKPIQLQVQRYAHKVVRADISWLSRFIGLFSNRSTKQMFEQLKDILRSQSVRYLILIDDLDRLGTEEIMRVIQLIRNIADFPNVVFIVAYDENYVLERIKDKVGQSIKDAQFYLQKIFTVPHYLPVKRPETLLDENSKRISSILGVTTEESQYQQITDFLKAINRELSLRESVLLANNTEQALARMKSTSGYTVCLYDALLLNLLQLVNNKVYEGLYKSYTMNPESKSTLLLGESELLELHDGKTSWDSFFEEKVDAESLDQGNSKSQTKSTKKKYIGFSERLEKHANKHRVDECSHILQLMFGKIGEKDTSINPIRKAERIEDNYRIKHKEVFAAYFENVLPGDIITQEEFDKVLASAKLFEYSLKRWVVEVNRSLLFRLLRNIKFENDEQGLSLLYASLILVSGQYIDTDESQNSILVLIGIDKYQQVLAKRNAMSGSGVSLDEENTYLNLYTAIILTFFRTIDNSENTRAKKMNLLSAYIHYESIFYILLRIYTKDKDTKTFIKDLYKPYVEKYLENTTSYSNFNKIYLWSLHKMYGENREELASLFKEHMRRYIISFMKNYPVSWLEQGDLFHTLFEDFNKKSWRTNMIEYLDSFSEEEKEEPEFIDYYKALTDLNRTHPN